MQHRCHVSRFAYRKAGRNDQGKQRPQVVLTLGERGSTVLDCGERYVQSAFRVNAVDTTAAGDTFTGYYLAGLSRGEPMDVILRRAAAASAIAVSRKGASISIPYAQDVEKALQAAGKNACFLDLSVI